MTWQRVLPVLVSIVVIILVAVLRAYSRTVAAITATMPLNVALGLWIVYAAEEGEQAAVSEFSRSMLIGIWPTVGFLVVIWLTARAGWRLIPMLAAGYAAWLLGLGVLFGLPSLTGP